MMLVGAGDSVGAYNLKTVHNNTLFLGPLLAASAKDKFICNYLTVLYDN